MATRQTDIDNTDWEDPDEGWEVVVEPDGPKIDWRNNPIFIGTYTGVKLVPDPDDPDSNLVLLKFKDEKGGPCSTFMNYGLQQAFGADGSAVPIGARVKIVHQGVADIGGGRTLNQMAVFVKKP